MSAILIGAIVLVVFFLILIVSLYNGLINKKNQVENAFGGMDVQLKKRYDLIPNLVAAVQQYTSHEKELLTRITELRSKAISPDLKSDDKVAIDNQISQAVKGIMVAVENYPDLKANQNFIELQKSLNEVEAQIAASRRAFNATVTDYNNAVQMFPGNIMAGFMNLQTKQVFVITEAERENVNVKNLFKA